MELKARLYTDSDYPEVKRWYAATQEGIPSPDLFPFDSTLIVEADNTPVFCLIVYLTNCKELCYFEGFIGNPDFSSSDRAEASKFMVEVACTFAKDFGYKRAMTFSYRDKVKQRISELGFQRTLNDLSAFVRELN